MKKINSFLISMICYSSFGQVDRSNQIGTIVTDRPDQTESSQVVPMGFVQIETGTYYEGVNSGKIKTNTSTYNTTLIRYGLFERMELRLGFDFSEVSIKGQSNKFSGFQPLSVGAKIAIVKENGWLPEIAFLGHLNLPFFAGNDFKPNYTSTDFRFSMSHTLNDKSSIGYNLGGVFGEETVGPSYVYSFVYGLSISNKTGTFIELYGDLMEKDKSNHLWNVGFTYLVNDHFQLDISGGSGITKDIQDYLISAGISFRIPR